MGGFARLALYPNRGVAWYWASLIGVGRRLVLVRDDTVDIPRGQVLDLRAPGLWSSMTCETPLDHWSVGLEAFAIAYDEASEALCSDRGDVVGLAFDLEWEALDPPAALVGADGYRQPCLVTGEILVGGETLTFAGHGHRSHRWGSQGWAVASRGAAWGVWSAGGSFATSLPQDAVVTADAMALPTQAELRLGGCEVSAEVVGTVPLPLEFPGEAPTALLLCLCQYRLAGSGDGAGWLATLTRRGERGGSR